MWACGDGRQVGINHMRGIKKLVRYSYGKLVHIPNAAGETPLHLALEAGKLLATEYLKEKVRGSYMIQHKCCTI